MITIKNPDIWMDFVFSIKGILYQCRNIEETSKVYKFRFEKVSGWSYPIFDIIIYRTPTTAHTHIKWTYQIESQSWIAGPYSGPVKDKSSHTLLTKDEIKDRGVVEKEMLWLLERSSR